MIRAIAVATMVMFAAACGVDTDDFGTTAQASSVHLKGGKNAQPSFFDLGLVLSASAAVSGLGNGDVRVAVTATADVTATCGNPGANTFQAPGQNPAPITVQGVEDIPQDKVKNGNVSFNVSTEEPVSPIPGAPDCPNSSWSELIEDLAFTSALITVAQPPNAPPVLTVFCTFDPATSDGPVPKNTVTCL